MFTILFVSVWNHSIQIWRRNSAKFQSVIKFLDVKQYHWSSYYSCPFSTRWSKHNGCFGFVLRTFSLFKHLVIWDLIHGGSCYTINIITYKLYKLARKSKVTVAEIISHSIASLIGITSISYTITSLQLLEDPYVSMSNRCLGQSLFTKITAVDDIIRAELWIKIETNPD